MYDNRSLFSDYYLSDLVRDDPHWKSTLPGIADLRHRIAEVYERGTPGIEQAAEGEVEERLIRPVLRALGHEFEVGPNVRSAEGTKTPDYGFFATVEDRRAADKAGIDGYWKHALAVGDAKAWDRSLDRRLKGLGDPFTNHNPSYQIDFYLRATDLKWGILTNGRLWRLYYRDLSYRLDVYYEVNLPELLEQGDEAFNYFAAFFAQRAFSPDEQGERFLDRAYKGSIAYATGLSKELKDNVYEALRLLTEGFLRFPANGLTPTDLDTVRENAFVVIYRLLFVLYAEDRGFLPLENRDYGDTYSLRALAKEIAQKMDGQTGFSPAASGYWSRLQDVFRMIDGGDTALGIPPYNGGLFDESRHPELGHWRIGDAYLARAVDKLTRAEAAQRTGRGFVSYRELSIRELGSIYEGLLEHRPRIADQPMVVIRDDKSERVIAEAEAQGKRVLGRYQPGEVYLTLHRGERKATGSYYTPDYIVKYIVANTVGLLLEEKKVEGGDLIGGIQSLKVLDPAMGSGHFLVEATDFLARALVEALGGDPRELGDDDIRWARREVVERCIYGVDLNPLAVELAKLSLWLHTVSRDRPLNFLDHHLRCGNSLIGAWLRDLGQLPQAGSKGTKKKAKQATAVTTLEGHGLTEAIAAAVKTFHVIAAAPTHSVEDVHMKENAYQTARHALSRIVDIADAWTSAHFGNEVDPDGYTQLLIDAYRGDGDWPKPGDVSWLDEVRRMGRQERRFLHWELEFPEVFFTRDGALMDSPGFDAVVGNPPYVDSEEMIRSQPELRDYCVRRWKAASGNWDEFVVFVELGLRLIRSGGRSSLIVPNKLLGAEYCAKVQSLLLANRIISISDYSQVEVFEANVYPVVYVVEKAEASYDDAVTLRTMADAALGEPENVAERQVALKVFATLPEGYWWPIFSGNIGVIAKVIEKSLPLSQCADVAGAATVSEAYELVRLLTPATPALQAGDYFAFINTGTIDRYESLWAITPTQYIKNAYDRPVVPKMPLRAEMPSRYEQARSPKIVLAGMVKVLEGYYDGEGAILAGKSTVVITNSSAGLPYVLSLLNSRLLTFLYGEVFGALALQGGFLRVGPPQVKKLPVRRIRFATTAEKRKRAEADARRLYEQALEDKDFGSLLSFVDDCLREKPNGSPDTAGEQSDVIHDLLCFLAEELTRLHHDKQDEATAFVRWLQGYVGLRLEDMKNRAKVVDYYGLEGGWDEFAAVLDQNRGTIRQAKGIDVTRREPREAIREEYEASMTRLRPVLRKIELTDRLIDLIVYRLYGLTDEEIAIVEGRGQAGEIAAAGLEESD